MHGPRPNRKGENVHRPLPFLAMVVLVLHRRQYRPSRAASPTVVAFCGVQAHSWCCHHPNSRACYYQRKSLAMCRRPSNPQPMVSWQPLDAVPSCLGPLHCSGHAIWAPPFVAFPCVELVHDQVEESFPRMTAVVVAAPRPRVLPTGPSLAAAWAQSCAVEEPGRLRGR